MTGTRIDPDTDSATTWETILDWTRLNVRLLGLAGVVILAAGLVFWFVTRSREIEAASAERALLLARRSMQAGNLPLAQSDLKKVYDKYGSTVPGVQAALLIAQLDFDQGKFQDGINVLREVSGKGAAEPMTSAIRSLIGDGTMMLKKPAEAAKEYEAAAAATNMENARNYERAKAARAYATAGDTASARRIWTELRDDPKSAAMATEARVRLGELEARVAQK